MFFNHCLNYFYFFSNLGLIQKLDYINGLGAKTICLSRAISKETVKKIDEPYGDESSMKELRKQLDERGFFYTNELIIFILFFKYKI